MICIFYMWRVNASGLHYQRGNLPFLHLYLVHQEDPDGETNIYFLVNFLSFIFSMMKKQCCKGNAALNGWEQLIKPLTG